MTKLVFGVTPKEMQKKREQRRDSISSKDRRTANYVARRLQGKGPWTPGEMEPTKAQLRLLDLLGLDTSKERYWHAKKFLKEAGFMGNGIPRGLSWQAAAKLSDDELLKRAKR
jgi:hypothetical protein